MPIPKIERNQIHYHNSSNSIVSIPNYGHQFLIDYNLKKYEPVILTDRDSVVQNQSVQFSFSNIEKIDSVKSNFGDGNFSSKIQPKHIYLDTGSYNIKLTVYLGSEIKNIEYNRLINVRKVYYPKIALDVYFGKEPILVNILNVYFLWKIVRNCPNQKNYVVYILIKLIITN